MSVMLAVVVATSSCHADVRAADAAEDVADFVSHSAEWVFWTMPPLLTLAGGEQEERIGRRMLDADVAALITTLTLKTLIEDDRPNDPQATDGFPSGHAARAWALAEAARIEDGSVMPYAYAFAAAVSWSRVELKEHTVEQALAGAAIGFAIGRASGHANGGLFQGTFVHDGGGNVASGMLPAWRGSSPGGQRPLITLWEKRW